MKRCCKCQSKCMDFVLPQSSWLADDEVLYVRHCFACNHNMFFRIVEVEVVPRAPAEGIPAPLHVVYRDKESP